MEEEQSVTCFSLVVKRDLADVHAAVLFEV